MLKKGISYSTIQFLSILYFVVWSISPFMEIDMIYRLLALASAALWFVFLVLRQKPLIVEGRQFVAIFFMVAVATVVYIETGKVSGVIKQIAYFMLVICFVICVYYRNLWHELRFIIPIALVLFIIFNIKTADAVIKDPTIARLIVRDDAAIYSYLRQGIGGYSLIYPQVCIFPATLQWTIAVFKKNKVYFVLGVVYLISYLSLAFNAGYSTAIFTTAVGTVLLLLYKGNSVVKAFLVSFFLFVCLMLAILYIDSFREWLLNTFKSGAIHHKIEDLVATSESGAAEGSIEARMIRYRASVDRIIRYPVIGALWRDSGGGHSAVLDTFAKYGIWGGGIYCYMIYYVPSFYRKNYKSIKTLRVANACMVSLLIVSLLNSLPYAFMAVLLIVLPILFEDIERWTVTGDEGPVDS